MQNLKWLGTEVCSSVDTLTLCHRIRVRALPSMALGSTTDITPLNPQSSKTQPLSLFYEGKTRWSTCWKPGSPEFKWRPLFQQSRDIRDHFHSSVGGTSDYRGLSPSISRYELTGAPYTILIAILCSSQNQNFLKSVCIIKGKKNNKRQPKEHEMRF